MSATKGPWGVRGRFIEADHNWATPAYGNGWGRTVVAHVAMNTSADREEAEANARQIAAAPELLEALRWTLEWIDAVPSDTVLPAMPGFDRDEVNRILIKAGVRP
jgi:hypothetical protein